MNKRDNEKKIQAVMESLDHVERATPGPYFFTRLSQQLENRQQAFRKGIVGLISKPAIAFASLFVIIILNLYLLFIQPNSNERFEESDEYSIATNNIYENENSNTE